MAVKTTDFTDVTPRVIDFVSRFSTRFVALQELIGISGMITTQAGTQIKVKKASLKNSALTASPAEGVSIGYTDFTVTETPIANITIEKYRRGVTLESINKYGYDTAVAKVDEAFLAALQSHVTDGLYTTLKASAGTSVKGATFQQAMAKAKASVIKTFRALNLDATSTIALVDIDAFYDYLGTADITVQTAFGLSYVENFLGFDKVILSDQVGADTIIATAGNNLNIYHVDPAAQDFGKAGLQYYTDGEANLIGLHEAGNYDTAVGDLFAVMGLVLAPEYSNGVVKSTIEAA